MVQCRRSRQVNARGLSPLKCESIFNEESSNYARSTERCRNSAEYVRATLWSKRRIAALAVYGQPLASELTELINGCSMALIQTDRVAFRHIQLREFCGALGQEAGKRPLDHPLPGKPLVSHPHNAFTQALSQASVIHQPN